MPNLTSSNYLVKSPKSHNYYFRIRVPDSVKRIVRMEELPYSVLTSDATEAKYRAIKMARFVKRLFALVKRKRYGRIEEGRY